MASSEFTGCHKYQLIIHLTKPKKIKRKSGETERKQNRGKERFQQNKQVDIDELSQSHHII